MMETQSCLRAVAVHTAMASSKTSAAQQQIASKTDTLLDAVPLTLQQNIVKAVWTVAMHRQQRLVQFGSSMIAVREHFPDYPLDNFRAPRELPAEELAVLLPYLAQRATIRRKPQIEERLRTATTIDTVYKQQALNIVNTAFRNLRRSHLDAGELCTPDSAMTMYPRNKLKDCHS